MTKDEKDAVRGRAIRALIDVVENVHDYDAEVRVKAAQHIIYAMDYDGRVHWDDIEGKPETATRWPVTGEIAFAESYGGTE